MSRKISQYFLVLIAILTLNSSVDMPGYLLYQNDSGRDNSSFNEIESVAELLCENVLNIHGQFPDKKNDATDNGQQTKKVSHTSFVLKFFKFGPIIRNSTETKLVSIYKVHFSDFTCDILSPPPQAV